MIEDSRIVKGDGVLPSSSPLHLVVEPEPAARRSYNEGSPLRRILNFLLVMMTVGGLIVFLSAVTQHWSKKRGLSPFTSSDDGKDLFGGSLLGGSPSDDGPTRKGSKVSESGANTPLGLTQKGNLGSTLGKEDPRHLPYPNPSRGSQGSSPTTWPQWALDFLVEDERTLKVDLGPSSRRRERSSAPVDLSSSTKVDEQPLLPSWFKCKANQLDEETSMIRDICSSQKQPQPTMRSSSTKFESDFDPSVRNTCFDNTNCSINNGCFMTEDGKCFSSPVTATFASSSKSSSSSSSPVVFDFQPQVQFDKERLDGKPWRSTPRGGDLEMKEQLSCAWQPETPDSEGEDKKRIEQLDLEDESPENVVKVFKLFTGGFFEKWYDWKADIKNLSATADGGSGSNDTSVGGSDDEFRYTGRHDYASDGTVFKLQNFCLTGLGAMFGWNPQDVPSLQEEPTWFSSYDENTPFISLTHEEREVFPALRSWLQEPRALKRKPSWYVDRKLHLMTTTRWHAHAAWALSSMGNLVWNVEAGFPKNKDGSGESSASRRDQQKGTAGSTNKVDWEDSKLNYAREDVTTAFIGLPVTESVNFALPCHKSMTCGFNPHWKPFLTTATTTHFFVPHHATSGMQAFAEHARQNLREELSSSSPLRSRLKHFLETRPVCFKEAVVYGSCYKKNCLSLQPNKSPAQWPIQGYRNPKVQNLIARRFRACAAVEKSLGGRTEPNRTSPTVFLPIRTAHLRGKFRNSETLPFRLLRMAEEAGYYSAENIRFIVGEMSKMTTIQHVAYYSISDVIFGTFGSAFLWGFLMPPGGSVGLEFRALDTAGAGVKIGGWVWRYGVDWPISIGINNNIWTDYGSMWRAQGGHQILVPFKKRYLFSDTNAVDQPDYTFDYPESAVKASFVDGALCVLKNGAAAAEEVVEESFARRNDAKGIQGKEAMAELREKSCPLEAKDVDPGPEEPSFQHDLLNDWKSDGKHLKRLIRGKLKEPLIPHAPRLAALIRAAPRIAELFKPTSTTASSTLRSTTAPPFPPALSIFPCALPSDTHEEQVLQQLRAQGRQIELDILHSYFAGSSATMFARTSMEARDRSTACSVWEGNPLKAPYGRLVRVKLKNGHHGRGYQDADSRVGLLSFMAREKADATTRAPTLTELLPANEVEENLWGAQARIHFKPFLDSSIGTKQAGQRGEAGGSPISSFSFVLVDADLWNNSTEMKKWIKNVIYLPPGPDTARRILERVFLLFSNGTYELASNI